MRRREFLRHTVAGAVVAGTQMMRLTRPLAGATSSRLPTRKPNIVLIVADDMGWNDVGYHGSEIATPNIDYLAEQGVELDRFYTCPVCSPTRAGLMTGRYPIRQGLQRTVVRDWDDKGMPPEEYLLPEMLARAGYDRRALFGKWHLGHAVRKYHPISQGFTEFYGHYNGAIDYYSHRTQGQVDWHRGFNHLTEHGYATDLVADEAVRFIRQTESEKPFFLCVPFFAPHNPNQAPKAYVRRYAHLEGQRRTHAAMTTCLDDGIGRILRALDDKRLADNALVWFLSDNGGFTSYGASNEPLRGMKGTLWEGGIRVPAIVRWPQALEGGRKIDIPIAYIDLFPTIQRIVGADNDPGEPLDGLDMLDVLRGETPGPKRDLLSYFEGWFTTERLAVMTPEWKLIRFAPGLPMCPPGFDIESLSVFCYDPERPMVPPETEVRVQLFRINEDPYEQHDLADDHPDVVDELLEKLHEFRALRPDDGVAPSYGPPKGWRAPKNWRFPDE